MQTSTARTYKYMRPLIDAGYIYSACPPIFGVKVGKKIHYVYPDGRTAEEALLAQAIEQYVPRDAEGKQRKYTVQRYKGLGEMDPQQLADTTMDPKTRILQRIGIEDAARAEQAVSRLMGTSVEYRRDYIEKHAKDARFLDA